MATDRGPTLGPVEVVDPFDGFTVKRKLPSWWGSGPDDVSTDVRALDRTHTPLGEQTLTVAKVGDYLPLIYGRAPVGGNIYRAKVYGGKLVIVIAWGEGEINAVESVIIDGDTFTGTATHYTGTSGQTGDSLVNTVWGQADDLAGIAYSVLSLPVGKGLQISAIIQGQKVYDPRTTSTVYSTNPALALADYLDTQSDWSVNWASVETAADYCDEIITGVTKRWEIGLVVKRGAIDDWIATLKEYANVYLYRDDGEIYFVPDEVRATDHTLTGADVKGLKLRKLGQRDAPTQVFCDYVLPTGNEWQPDDQSTPDVSAPDPLRITRLRMSGYFRAVHAKRKAVEVLNRATLEDLEATFNAFDNGLKITKGDICDITHPLGLTNKLFRVHEADPLPRGRWRITAREYDAATYSNATVSDPSSPDTGLPSPLDVPDGPTPTLTEVLFEDEGGKTFSRYEVTFTGVDWPWVEAYRVKVSAGATVIYDANRSHDGEVTHTVATPPIKQDILYTVEVWVVGQLGLQGDVAGSTTDTSDGKQLLPTAPSNLQGFEAGQFVSLTWDKGIDLDFIGSIIKRIPQADYVPSTAWTHSNAVTVQSRIDAEAALLFAQPVGTYYYMVKSMDSLGQESTGQADKLITVTADNAGGVSLKELIQDNTALTNMHVFEIYGDATYVVSSEGNSWIDIFGAAGSAWNLNLSTGDGWNVTDNAASSMETAEWDIGSDKQGNWVWSLNYTVTQGTVTFTTQVAKAADYPTFTDHTGTSVNAEARYFKGKIACTAAPGDGVLLRMPVDATFQGRILEDNQIVSVPATGQPLAVTWGEPFAAQPAIKIAVQGSAFRVVTYDSPTEDGCDLYAWDGSGTAAAATVEITAKGT